MTADMTNADALLLAEEAIRKAGAFLKGRFGHALKPASEQGRDIKLKEDMEAERIILDVLARSGIPALSEESFASQDVNPADAEAAWVVDPLDGSANFNRGLDFCCTSIALFRHGKPALGMIYDFNRDHLYVGEVGKGATLNGAPMTVSPIKDPSKGILVTGLPVQTDHSPEALAEVARRFAAFKKVRMIGSAAMAMALVASGVADRYGENDIFIWDVAAGLALIEAAGGVIEVAPSGRHPHTRHVKAACHPALLAV